MSTLDPQIYDVYTLQILINFELTFWTSNLIKCSTHLGIKKLPQLDVDYKSNVGSITERNICNLLGSDFENPHYISFMKSLS